LEQPNPPTGEETAEIQRLEDQLSVNTIVLFRQLALAEVRIERAATKAGLRAYKQAKHDELGSRTKRMQVLADLHRLDSVQYNLPILLLAWKHGGVYSK
jgi:hypothetical protein